MSQHADEVTRAADSGARLTFAHTPPPKPTFPIARPATLAALAAARDAEIAFLQTLAARGQMALDDSMRYVAALRAQP